MFLRLTYHGRYLLKFCSWVRIWFKRLMKWTLHDVFENTHLKLPLRVPFLNLFSKDSKNSKYRTWRSSPPSVFRKICSENMQQMNRRTPMSKCDFNKVAEQLNWGRIELALWHGCSPVNLLHIFRIPFHNTFGELLLNLKNIGKLLVKIKFAWKDRI